jgi:hypothetical protein
MNAVGKIESKLYFCESAYCSFANCLFTINPNFHDYLYFLSLS